MTWRRWTSFAVFTLAISLASRPAAAQLALPAAGPSGGAGGANSSGGYGASVPLSLPDARGGLPVPVAITYSERGVGAAGKGWDVPLSYIRRDTTILHRRPRGNANVAPQAREQVFVVLEGQRIDLVHTTDGWVAQRDAAGLRVREQSDGTWVMYDAEGRTYLFSAAAPALAGTGLWLLQDVTGPGGTKVHLEYSVTTPALPGNIAIAIDLAAVRYNAHPTTAGCYKHSVTLTYDPDERAPLSLSPLGNKILARQHKLHAVEVSGKATCTDGDVRLRRYELSYQPDADTQQPRLQSVQVFGRADKDGASTSITIAKYSYGSATSGGRLTYQFAQPLTGANLGFTTTGTAAVTGFGGGFDTRQMLVDVTGDGRPDFVNFDGGELLVRRNKSAVNSIALGTPGTLSDVTLAAKPLGAQTAQLHATGTLVPGYNRVWRQVIDVNGDGRADIVDAAEMPGRWVVYLNTPTAGDPGVTWQKRSFSITALAQQLASRGLFIEGDKLPLARHAIASDGLVATCWEWVPKGPKPRDGGKWQVAQNPPVGCTPAEPPLLNKTLAEWELTDVNGDGYPDVVFNSSKAIIKAQIESDERESVGAPGEFAAVVESHTAMPKLGNTNKIEAVLDVVGAHLQDGDDAAFSAPVTLASSEPCGLEQWVPDSPFSANAQHMQCALVDVNGDGIVDRVNGSSVSLGTGRFDGTGFFTPQPMLALPGPLAAHTTDQSNCVSPSSTFSARQTAGLRDVTGDGIPDYVASAGQNGWTVAIGTGTGFRTAIPAGDTFAFALPVTKENCDGVSSLTVSGLFDIDGDGRPEFVSTQGDVYVLIGSDGVGAPAAGRLTQIDNGFGAQTAIRYRSIKGDSGVVHQIPFSEIVVDSVETTGSKGLGGSLSATRYAYGGAELVFDGARDAFLFPGYRRKLVLQAPVGQAPGVATITITDAYAPVSAVDPYGLAGGPRDAAQRYLLSLRTGRTSDVTVLSGQFGVAALASPSQLLGIVVGSDSKRIAFSHFEWGARRIGAGTPTDSQETCIEAVYPYSYADSSTFAQGADHYDPCMAYGFMHVQSVKSWRGEPGAAESSAAGVATFSEVTGIDNFARVLSVKNSNDALSTRGDDDLCTSLAYAEPAGANERVLTATLSRTVTDCGSAVLAKDLWEYDERTDGKVSRGLVSSHTVERHDDSGALLSTIRQFDATFDDFANPKSITSKREDGAIRTATPTFDAFGLALTRLETSATNVPTTTISIDRDPLTLAAIGTTDENGTRHGAWLDGFDRQTRSTITPPGGAERTLSYVEYLGFDGTDPPRLPGEPAGRQIVQKVFTEIVAPNDAPTAAGRRSKVFLDELGRATEGRLELGVNRSNQVLIAGHRTYDGLGRVVFEADPYPSTQDVGTAYGTTQFFNADGTPSCMVRGKGQQGTLANPVATVEDQELFPTCIERHFEDNTEVVTVRDAASYLAHSPQEKVTKKSYATAIGRVLTRSTWQDQARLEHATFAYDRLGHRTGMTRYQDAAGASKPVTSSWHYDSLGQLLELDEPDSAPRFYNYSNWGDLLKASRGPTATASPTAVVATTYDALGRAIHREQQVNGIVDPETLNDYFYDQAANVAPQVTATNVLGRLSQATSPTGSVSFSYDGLGQMNARVFTDSQGVYVEKRSFLADGSLGRIDLVLPDATFNSEHILYEYDSAGHGTSVKYGVGDNDEVTDVLYTASEIDAFDRVRKAQYGQANFSADYADVGRRLLGQVTVSSMAGSRGIKFDGFDPVGREKSRTETKADASTGTITSTTSYAYDALGRLSSSTKTAGTSTLFNQQFTYDPLGNILSLSDTSGQPGAINTTLSYLETDRDRICQIAYGTAGGNACNVTYNDIGDITSMPTATGARHYSYLADGSVRTISDDHGIEAHFRYDAFGNVQELELNSTMPPFAADVRHDRRIGDLLAWREESTNSSPRHSVLLRKIPGPDGFLATRHGATGPWVFAFGESRGSRFFTDQGGAFVQDVDYQPFGAATSTGAQPGSNLYSSEQWNDGDSLQAFGIVQVGARLYDPAIGRFLSRDPLLIPRTAATTNPYAFAYNDPVNSSDPTGLDPPVCNDVTKKNTCVSNEGQEKPPGGNQPPPAPPADDPPTGGTAGSPGTIGVHFGDGPHEYTGSAGTRGSGGPQPPTPTPVNGARAGALAIGLLPAAGAGVATAGTATGTSLGTGLGTLFSRLATVGGDVLLLAAPFAIGAYAQYRAVEYGFDPDLAMCGGQAECMGAISTAKGFQFSQEITAEADRLARIRERAEAARADREERRVHLYRGVTVGHPGYDAATRGIAIPRGGHDDPYLHNGDETDSIFTSWTTRRSVAEDFALRNGAGVVLDQWIPVSRLRRSPDRHEEGEVLVIGPIFGAGVNYVPKGADIW